MAWGLREHLHAAQYKALLLVQQFGKRADYVVNTLSVLAAVLSLGNVIWQIGFNLSADSAQWLITANKCLIGLYALIQIYRLGSSLIQTRRATTWQLAYMAALWTYVLYDPTGTSLEWIGYRYVVDAVLVVAASYDVSTFGMSFLTRRSSPTMLFAGSFVIFIMLGTGLLLMPRCHYDDLTFLQALFTSTSALCVNGLSVVDVATGFTHFGQVVIITLVQIGGLGVMTFTCFFALSMSSKGSLHGSMVIKDIVSADNISDIFQTLKHIMYVTFIIEGLSVWVLYYYFRDVFPGAPQADVIFFAIFHGISAFCNAGITNIEGGLANPSIIHSNLLHVTIAATVVFGGAGFPVQSAAINWVKTRLVNLFHRLTGRGLALGTSNLRLINASNRLTFYTHMILLVVGTLFFLVSESGHSQAGHSFTERLTDSFFMSACARTAGFAYADILTVAGPTAIMFILLMWIGCAPMSTGGGIKVTTFAIGVLNLRSVLQGRDSIEIFGRRISPVSIQKAFAAIALSVIAVLVSTVVLKLLMPDTELSRLCFESFSALSTVGLTMDLTPNLSHAAQLVIIVDMFIGRIGIMAFLLIFITPGTPKRYKYPLENIMI